MFHGTQFPSHPSIHREMGGVPSFQASGLFARERGGIQEDVIAKIKGGDATILRLLADKCGRDTVQQLVMALNGSDISALRAAIANLGAAKDAAVTDYPADSNSVRFIDVEGGDILVPPIPQNSAPNQSLLKTGLLQGILRTPQQIVNTDTVIPPAGTISFNLGVAGPQLVQTVYVDIGANIVNAAANSRFSMRVTGYDEFGGAFDSTLFTLALRSNVKRMIVLFSPWRIVSAQPTPLQLFTRGPASTAALTGTQVPDSAGDVEGAVTVGLPSQNINITINGPEGTQINASPVGANHPAFYELERRLTAAIGCKSC